MPIGGALFNSVSDASQAVNLALSAIDGSTQSMVRAALTWIDISLSVGGCAIGATDLRVGLLIICPLRSQVGLLHQTAHYWANEGVLWMRACVGE